MISLLNRQNVPLTNASVSLVSEKRESFFRKNEGFQTLWDNTLSWSRMQSVCMSATVEILGRVQTAPVVYSKKWWRQQALSALFADSIIIKQICFPSHILGVHTEILCICIVRQKYK